MVGPGSGARRRSFCRQIFRRHGHWGAAARSNYSGLRFRDPVYLTLRELAISYLEHDFNLAGEKTLRKQFSLGINQLEAGLSGKAIPSCLAAAATARSAVHSLNPSISADASRCMSIQPRPAPHKRRDSNR